MPTIFDPEGGHLSAKAKHLKSPVSVPFVLFEEQDKIKSFYDIDSTLIISGYTFQIYDDRCVVLYQLETNVLNIPEVTDCERVN